MKNSSLIVFYSIFSALEQHKYFCNFYVDNFWIINEEARTLIFRAQSSERSEGVSTKNNGLKSIISAFRRRADLQGFDESW